MSDMCGKSLHMFFLMAVSVDMVLRACLHEVSVMWCALRGLGWIKLFFCMAEP